VDQNVSLCDLFATLCDLCGIETPPGLDSRSLRPLLEGQNADDRPDEAISQWNETHLMVKQGALKYEAHEGCGEVLFDLAADPTERQNFAADPAYRSEMNRVRERARELKPELVASASRV